VIDGAIQIRVLFNDGSQISARLLAASPLSDVALLKVDVDHPLPRCHFPLRAVLIPRASSASAIAWSVFTPLARIYSMMGTPRSRTLRLRLPQLGLVAENSLSLLGCQRVR
jgi:hypothetical protein